MYKPETYVACLASYNSDYIHGKWIAPNQSEGAIIEEIYVMLDDSPAPGD